MKKLSKIYKQNLAHQRGLIDEKYQEMNAAIAEFNAALAAASEPLQAAVAAINQEIERAQEIIEDIATEITNYQQGRSEKWEASDAGQSHLAWGETFQITLERVELETPEPIEPEINFVAIDQIDGLEEEPT